MHINICNQIHYSTSCSGICTTISSLPSKKKQCGVQGAASGMRSKVALFLEVRDNFSEGLRFYMSLQEAISHLAQQVGDYSMTRQIQR